jgi:hypothetical protein
MDEEFKTITTVPKFDGTKASYPKWVLVFQSYCANKGFGTALQSSTAGLPPTDSSVPQDKDEEAKWNLAKKRNAAAMNAISLACQDSEQMISLIWDAIDSDWPQGVAWKTW